MFSLLNGAQDGSVVHVVLAGGFAEPFEQVVNGEIEAFAAPVYDNAGNCVLAEGQEFTMDDYINMTFLLDNVIGTLPE